MSFWLTVVKLAAVHRPQACATWCPHIHTHAHTHTFHQWLSVVIALLPETDALLDVAAGASVERCCEELLEVSWASNRAYRFRFDRMTGSGFNSLSVLPLPVDGWLTPVRQSTGDEMSVWDVPAIINGRMLLAHLSQLQWRSWTLPQQPWYVPFSRVGRFTPPSPVRFLSV